MPVKNLKNAYLRVSVETSYQLSAVIECPLVDLIYIDAGFFPPSEWPDIIKMIHKGTGGFGKLAGLRLPQIWRRKTEEFFFTIGEVWKNAGFDLFLARNMEEILWLKENGISAECIISDASVYLFNELSESALMEISGMDIIAETFSPELNSRELRQFSKKAQKNHSEIQRELIVYGRTPLMVTAQCLRKTSIGCDRRKSLLWMKDRTGAMMPVKNICPFCCNTIYNSVPTVIYDLSDEIGAIAPNSIRYEFTTENQELTKQILNGKIPDQFTRGHFKRGVL